MKSKRKFYAPVVTEVVNEVLMAGAGPCNDIFIYTSAGGSTSAGYANICYHYRSSIDENSYGYLRTKDAVKVTLPKEGVVFSTSHEIREEDGGKKFRSGGTYLSENFLGWDNFQGTNGECHFIGDIYVNGVLLTPDNMGPYISGGAAPHN